jgi:hypothetical protein
VTTLSPGAGLQSMANYIIENADKFQKKAKKVNDFGHIVDLFNNIRKSKFLPINWNQQLWMKRSQG